MRGKLPVQPVCRNTFSDARTRKPHPLVVKPGSPDTNTDRATFLCFNADVSRQLSVVWKFQVATVVFCATGDTRPTIATFAQMQKIC